MLKPTSHYPTDPTPYPLYDGNTDADLPLTHPTLPHTSNPFNPMPPSGDSLRRLQC